MIRNQFKSFFGGKKVASHRRQCRRRCRRHRRRRRRQARLEPVKHLEADGVGLTDSKLSLDQKIGFPFENRKKCFLRKQK